MYSRIPLRTDEPSLFIVFGTIIQETYSSRRHLYDALAKAVDEGLGNNAGLVCQRDGFPNTIIMNIICMVELSLSRTVVMEYGAIGMPFRDKDSPSRSGDGFCQSVVSIHCRGHSSQRIRLGNGSSQGVVFVAFHSGHGANIPARLQNAVGSITGIGNDSFRSDHHISVTYFRTNGFHKLMG